MNQFFTRRHDDECAGKKNQQSFTLVTFSPCKWDIIHKISAKKWSAPLTFNVKEDDDDWFYLGFKKLQHGIASNGLRGTSCGFQWVQKPSFWGSPTPTPYLDLLWVGFNLVYFLGPCSAPFLVYQWYSKTAIYRPLKLNASLGQK